MLWASDRSQASNWSILRVTRNTRWGLVKLTRTFCSMAIAVLAASLLTGVACEQSVANSDDPAFDAGLAEMGSEVYQRRCASCHGVDARGHGPASGALKVPPSDLTQIAHRRGGKFPDSEIALFIDGRFDLPAHGSRDMPIWGARLGEAIPESSLAEEVVRGKIATLIEYLKSIQRGTD
jgi:mono/diheme cytochrome c family protein